MSAELHPRFAIAAAALVAAACGSAAPRGLVGGELLLPHQLREASSVVGVDADTIACVQDEVGALFFVSLSGAQPLRKAEFGPRGDYEGLALVGGTYWVLRADGVLHELRADGERFRIARSVTLPAGFRDWEGVCHDAARGRLLVMPKDRPGGDKDARDLRPVFAVDPVAGVVDAEPFVVWRRSAWLDQALARGFDVPVRTTDKGKEKVQLELVCSEILPAREPGQYFLLAAGDRVLLRVDLDGRLLGVRRLDPAKLPQAEGMTFLADGRLLVVSEADGGQARGMVVTPP